MARAITACCRHCRLNKQMLTMRIKDAAVSCLVIVQYSISCIQRLQISHPLLILVAPARKVHLGSVLYLKFIRTTIHRFHWKWISGVHNDTVGHVRCFLKPMPPLLYRCSSNRPPLESNTNSIIYWFINFRRNVNTLRKNSHWTGTYL